MSVDTLDDPRTSSIDPSQQEGTLTQQELDKREDWLERIADACESAARGDLEVRLLNVDIDGDMARAIHAINSLLDYTDAFVREAKAVLECSAQGKFFRRVVPRGMCGAFKQASLVINSAAQEMEDKSQEVTQASVRRLRMADEFDASVKQATQDVASTASQLHNTSTELLNTAQATSDQSSTAMDASGSAVENFRNVSDSTTHLQMAVMQVDEKVQESATIVNRAVSEASEAKEIIAG